MAGFTALANQLAEAHGQPPVGFINPAIYALGQGAGYNSIFHDITIGNNTTTASPNNFFAVPGYDLCTGWGTPNGTNLLYALALPDHLQITPGTNLYSSGAVGGPFSPAAQTYSLEDAGASALDWSLANTAAWLDASPNGGTLAPGAPATTITVTVNSQANDLPAGTYTTSLSFTNLNNGSVQSRRFTLAVAGPPIVISGPDSQSVLEGETAIFTVVAAPNAPLSYQWVRDGIVVTDDDNISGATTGTLTIRNVSSAEVGHYSVFVANTIGFYSSQFAVLTVPSPPIIVAPATDQIVLPGATATFAIAAVGTHHDPEQCHQHRVPCILLLPQPEERIFPR